MKEKSTRVLWLNYCIKLSGTTKVLNLMPLLEDDERLRWNHSRGMLEVIRIKQEHRERPISF